MRVMAKELQGPNFEKMYYSLFNGITSAIKAMESQNFGQAVELLKNAQRETEEMYIEAEE